MNLTVNPVVLETVGDAYLDPVRVLAIVWEGATTAGDTADVRHRGTAKPFWRGRTNDTQTYLGVNLGPTGLHAPTGFILHQISAGRVLVYLKEE